MEVGELKHYGVLGMKWGVRRYQPYPDGKKKGKEIGEAAQKARAEKLQQHYNKASTKLDKIDKKYKKKQEEANKMYSKAEKQLFGFFGSKERGAKAFAKASEIQYKANKIAYQGKKWYEAMENSFGQSYIRDLDPVAIKKGNEFVMRIQNNSAAMYNESLVRRLSS